MTKEDFIDARTKLGLSQGGLSKLLGWHPHHLSKVERGIKIITTQTELAIECLLRREGKWTIEGETT